MSSQTKNLKKSTVYGTFAGAVMGSTCWLLIMSVIVQDWLIAIAILAFDALLLFISAEICFRKPGKYWNIAIGNLAALAAINFLIVNLKWQSWIKLYRQSRFYQTSNDFSLMSINLILAGVFGGLFFLFLILSTRQKSYKKQLSTS